MKCLPYLSSNRRIVSTKFCTPIWSRYLRQGRAQARNKRVSGTSFARSACQQFTHRKGPPRNGGNPTPNTRPMSPENQCSTACHTSAEDDALPHTQHPRERRTVHWVFDHSVLQAECSFVDESRHHALLDFLSGELQLRSALASGFQNRSGLPKTLRVHVSRRQWRAKSVVKDSKERSQQHHLPRGCLAWTSTCHRTCDIISCTTINALTQREHKIRLVTPHAYMKKPFPDLRPSMPFSIIL